MAGRGSAMSWGPLRKTSSAAEPKADSALRQAREVFLAGNHLPTRWTGRQRFVVLDTDFGLGHRFLTTWQAWQQDAGRCHQLWYLAITPTPPQRESLALVHAGSSLQGLADALSARWPPLTPDLHLIDVDGGRVRLLLALGDVAQVLPELVARVDAFFLTGKVSLADPSWDRYRLRSLARLAADGATLAATGLDDRSREGLTATGFVVEAATGAQDTLACDAACQTTIARHCPRFSSSAPPGRQAMATSPRQRVAVLGAGLAGAAVAKALAAQGLAVQVFDRQPGCAGETSGNAGGLFHGIVHGQDGTHARWLRAAAIHTERLLRPLVAAQQVTGGVAGLWRGEQTMNPEAMAEMIARLGLPAAYVSVQRDALPDGRPAWVYPGGGWVEPTSLCAHWLNAPGITTIYNTSIDRLQRLRDGWRLFDLSGRCLAEVDAVMLCNAADAARLAGSAGSDQPNLPNLPTLPTSPNLPTLPTQPIWPLHRLRGQTSLLPAHLPGQPDLARPLVDTGYVLQLADGRWLCGASSQADDGDSTLRAEDHALNLATLRRLTGWAGPTDAALDGRVGWRLQSADRLPLIGAVPVAEPAAGWRRLDQPRFVPRQPGLYVFTALGSRGITQAALGGELLASWLTGAPMPAPASLLDALDPARFVARAQRRPQVMR